MPPIPAAGAIDSDDDLATADADVVAAPKASSMRRTTKKTAIKRKAAPTKARTALKDRTNIPVLEDTHEALEDEIAPPKAKRARTTKTAPKPAARELDIILETQPDPPPDEEVEQSIEIEEQDDEIASHQEAQAMVPRARTASVQPVQARVGPVARAASVQPVFPPSRERSTSITATERDRRGGDSELRRQLANMTQKYEGIHLKYQNLQEIGQREAESNFDKLKRASDQRIKDANDLIASLKKELAEVKRATSTRTAETTTLQTQVSSLTASNQQLDKANAELKERLGNDQAAHKAAQADLAEKLQAAHNETRAIEAKLVATRQQLTSTQEAKTSDRSAARNGPTQASDAQKEARMKENLYSDLTGLIIRGVKRKDGEDEYDCLQTGRNGTLHFHLSVANDASIANPKTPSGLSYEDAEFAYEPFLDESRDRELLRLLPDYLTEEICFPRCHAVKFYSRVVECMTKKIVVEEDD